MPPPIFPSALTMKQQRYVSDLPWAYQSVEASRLALVPDALVSISVTPRTTVLATHCLPASALMCKEPVETSNVGILGTGRSRPNDQVDQDSHAARSRFLLIVVHPHVAITEPFIRWIGLENVGLVIVHGPSSRTDLNSTRSLRVAMAKAYPEVSRCVAPAFRGSPAGGLVPMPVDTVLVVSDVGHRSVTYGVRPRAERLCRQLGIELTFLGDRSGLIYCYDPTERRRILQLLAALEIPGHAVPHRADGRPGSAVGARRPQKGHAVVRVGPATDPQDARVDFVLHTRMPPSLDTYLSDTRVVGFGTRLPDCRIYHKVEDAEAWRSAIRVTNKSNEPALRALAAMEHYCTTPLCRHVQILKHLDPSTGRPAWYRFTCNSCDVCMESAVHVLYEDDDGTDRDWSALDTLPAVFSKPEAAKWERGGHAAVVAGQV